MYNNKGYIVKIKHQWSANGISELSTTNINLNLKRHKRIFLPSGDTRIKKLMSVHTDREQLFS